MKIHEYVLPVYIIIGLGILFDLLISRPWTFAETTMSNEYFRLLLEERWSPKTSHNGKPWNGPFQFEDSTGKLMMLPSDIALIEDPEFKKYVEMYAKDEDLFFKHFAKAFSKLLELGVQFPKPWWRII